VIELEYGEEQVQGKSGVRLQLFVKGEEDVVLRDTGDFSAMEEAPCDDVEDLAWFRAEDAGEVDGLVSGEGGSDWSPGIGDETAAGHS
jgi:hypothetical protein